MKEPNRLVELDKKVDIAPGLASPRATEPNRSSDRTPRPSSSARWCRLGLGHQDGNEPEQPGETPRSGHARLLPFRDLGARSISMPKSDSSALASGPWD